jgi:hypothetical protein
MNDAPAWTIALLGLGIFGMLMGPPIAGWLVPETAVWTEANAVELSRASAELHAAMHAQSDAASHDHNGHSASNHSGHKASDHGEHRHSSLPLVEAQAAYDAQQQKLVALRSRRGWLLTGTRGIGIALALAGLAGIVLRRKSP